MSSQQAIPVEVLGVPKKNEWGPILWEILHGLVERLGKTTVPQMLIDQRREMILVLRYVENIMPCAVCRKHFHEWRTSNPLDKLPQKSDEFVTSLRAWLYNLHNEVNESRQIPSPFPIEELSARYSSVVFRSKLEVLFPLLNRAVRLKEIDIESLKKFRTHLNLLLAFI